MNWPKPDKRTIALVVAAAAASAVLIWFGASVVAGPRMLYVSLDPPGPEPTPKPMPTTFNAAGKLACKTYWIEYKLWLAIRQNEMGRRGMEMGVRGRNAGIEVDHPIFPQAYQAAVIVAKRQREFCADKKLRERFSTYRDPFVAYVCSKWRPRNWQGYYWNERGGGVGASYRKDSITKLEAKIEKKAIEEFGASW